MNYEQIYSIDELRTICKKEGQFDGFILIGNYARSSKYIEYDESEEMWMIDNMIDDSREELTESEMAETNIALAMRNGRFYAY